MVLMYVQIVHTVFFFFNDTATTEIYTLSLHDALPICHLNRETSTTDANSHTASFTLDALGEMTSKTDKNGRVANYTIDHDGRLTEEDWMSGGTAIYSAIYAYNAASLTTSASDNFSDYAYAYSANDQVTSVDNN